jgi:hypothetical protein
LPLRSAFAGQRAAWIDGIVRTALVKLQLLDRLATIEEFFFQWRRLSEP